MRHPEWPLLIPLSPSLCFSLQIEHCYFFLLPSITFSLTFPPPSRPHPCKKQRSTKFVLKLYWFWNIAQLPRECGRAGFGPGQVTLGAGALGGPVGGGQGQVLERAPLQASCQRVQVPLGHRKCYVSSRKDPKCHRLVTSMGSPAGHKQGKWAAVGGGMPGRSCGDRSISSRGAEPEKEV